MADRAATEERRAASVRDRGRQRHRGRRRRQRGDGRRDGGGARAAATGSGAAGGAGTGGGGAAAAAAARRRRGAVGTGGVSGRGGQGGGGTGGASGQSGQSGGAGQTAPVDQTAPGPKAAAPLLDNFDGLAVGNPTDLSLAVGPNHIVQVVNWSMAVYSKKGAMYATTGMSLRGPVTSNTPFAGAGGRCEARSGDAAADRGDVVVRYDQLAQRWVFLQPVFRSPYAMCYAVSDGPDPLGTYHHYEFARPLFPDYPRLGDLAGRLLRRQQHRRRRRAEDDLRGRPHADARRASRPPSSA